MNDEFETRKVKFKPRERLNHNIQLNHWCTRVYRHLQGVQRYYYESCSSILSMVYISCSFVSNSSSEITISKNKEKVPLNPRKY